MSIGGWSPTDSHPHGDLTVSQVIQQSSNIGAAKLALDMQPREMYEVFTAVGLGQRPQISFPGARTGTLRPYKSWRRIEQATMAYGYGLSASLFQLAHAYTLFARDGEVIPVTMMNAAARHRRARQAASSSEKTTQELRAMLAARRRPGRHPRPQAMTPGYSVGGQVRHRLQARGQGLCEQQVPLLDRRRLADQQAAHRRSR